MPVPSRCLSLSLPVFRVAPSLTLQRLFPGPAVSRAGTPCTTSSCLRARCAAHVEQITVAVAKVRRCRRPLRRGAARRWGTVVVRCGFGWTLRRRGDPQHVRFGHACKASKALVPLDSTARRWSTFGSEALTDKADKADRATQSATTAAGVRVRPSLAHAAIDATHRPAGRRGEARGRRHQRREGARSEEHTSLAATRSDDGAKRSEAGAERDAWCIAVKARGLRAAAWIPKERIKKEKERMKMCNQLGTPCKR